MNAEKWHHSEKRIAIRPNDESLGSMGEAELERLVRG